jgi:peptidoglycan-associated lipoprotein
MKISCKLVVCVGVFFCLVGCHKRILIKEPFSVPVGEKPIEQKVWNTIESERPYIVLGVVCFDYDKSELRLDAVMQLRKNAKILRMAEKVLIEGHCDERGTVEYNLALGQKRADVVRDYYKYLGIRSEKITTISYGKEKPIDERTTEEAWAKNRRVETKATIRIGSKNIEE